MRVIVTATKIVFSNPEYLLLFLVFAIVLFFLLVAIPVKTIPGNTFEYQLAIFTLQDYLLLVTLTIVSSLLLTMNLYLLVNRVRSASSTGVFPAFIAGVFGTAACSSCLAGLLGFLGFPVIVFLLQIKWYITAIAAGIVFFSLWWTAKQIAKNCQVCK